MEKKQIKMMTRDYDEGLAFSKMSLLFHKLGYDNVILKMDWVSNLPATTIKIGSKKIQAIIRFISLYECEEARIIWRTKEKQGQFSFSTQFYSEEYIVNNIHETLNAIITHSESQGDNNASSK